MGVYTTASGTTSPQSNVEVVKVIDQNGIVLQGNPILGTGTNVIGLVENVVVTDTPEFLEDASFVTGDSPVTLDLNAALGRNSKSGYITNDGDGNFTYSFSTDGSAFGDAITLKPGETDHWKDISVDSIKITWVADSSYRVVFI